MLNACRHQRSVHKGKGIGIRHMGECSTPVGIKDRFTRFAGRPTTCESCAQRLSASKIGSPGVTGSFAVSG